MRDKFLQSKAWRDTRKIALDRDDHKCIFCGSQHKVTVHHMFPRAYYKTLKLDVDNLICVCPKHHWLIHKSCWNFHLLIWLRYNRPKQYQYVLEHIHDSDLAGKYQLKIS